MGAEVIYATDEFFASKERLIKDTEPQFIPTNMTIMASGWTAGNHAVAGTAAMTIV